MSRSVHQLYSLFLDSLHDPRCLYTAFTSYKNASNSTTPIPSDNTRAQRLDQLHLTSLLPWVAMGCYGLLWLIMQQISYYMAARPIYQILVLYDVRALGRHVITNTCVIHPPTTIHTWYPDAIVRTCKNSCIYIYI